MTRTTTPAPDFTSTRPYPSAGALIGPAWQRIWDELHDLAEADGGYLGAIVAARVELTEGMVTRLLREAVAAGWLRVGGEGRARRNRVYSLTHAARCCSVGGLPAALRASQGPGGPLGHAGDPKNVSEPAGAPRNRYGRVHG